MEGSTDPEIVGYQRVKVGEEQVVVGTETVKVGTEQILDGYDRELVRLERSDDVTADTEMFGSGYKIFGQSPSSYAEVLFGKLPDLNQPSASAFRAASAYTEV